MKLSKILMIAVFTISFLLILIYNQISFDAVRYLLNILLLCSVFLPILSFSIYKLHKASQAADFWASMTPVFFFIATSSIVQGFYESLGNPATILGSDVLTFAAQVLLIWAIFQSHLKPKPASDGSSLRNMIAFVAVFVLVVMFILQPLMYDMFDFSTRQKIHVILSGDIATLVALFIYVKNLNLGGFMGRALKMFTFGIFIFTLSDILKFYGMFAVANLSSFYFFANFVRFVSYAYLAYSMLCYRESLLGN